MGDLASQKNWFYFTYWSANKKGQHLSFNEKYELIEEVLKKYYRTLKMVRTSLTLYIRRRGGVETPNEK